MKKHYLILLLFLICSGCTKARLVQVFGDNTHYDCQHLEKYQGASPEEAVKIYQYCASDPSKDLTVDRYGFKTSWTGERIPR